MDPPSSIHTSIHICYGLRQVRRWKLMQKVLYSVLNSITPSGLVVLLEFGRTFVTISCYKWHYARNSLNIFKCNLHNSQQSRQRSNCSFSKKKTLSGKAPFKNMIATETVTKPKGLECSETLSSQFIQWYPDNSPPEQFAPDNLPPIFKQLDPHSFIHHRAKRAAKYINARLYVLQIILRSFIHYRTNYSLFFYPLPNLKLGGELSEANCPGGELSDIPFKRCQRSTRLANKTCACCSVSVSHLGIAKT